MKQEANVFYLFAPESRDKFYFSKKLRVGVVDVVVADIVQQQKLV